MRPGPNNTGMFHMCLMYSIHSYIPIFQTKTQDSIYQNLSPPQKSHQVLDQIYENISQQDQDQTTQVCFIHA